MHKIYYMCVVLCVCAKVVINEPLANKWITAAHKPYTYCTKQFNLHAIYAAARSVI